MRRRQAWHRRTLGKLFNRIVRALAIGGIRDTQCGFKLFDGDVARDLFAGARIDRFAYDVEILAPPARGISIAEIPVLFNSRVKVSVCAISFRRSGTSSASAGDPPGGAAEQPVTLRLRVRSTSQETRSSKCEGYCSLERD